MMFDSKAGSPIHVKGMCRVLDLLGKEMSEVTGMSLSSVVAMRLNLNRNSVEEFLFAQHCIRDFINALMSLDVKALHLFPVKPIGVSGSKADVVRFLLTIGSLDDTLSACLIVLIFVQY
jgi:hypothetical protein